MDLIDFRESYCESPDFKSLAVPFHYYVPGRGAERPVAMVLGTAPGSAENTARKVFVGQLGRILDQLLGVAGLSLEENAYVTHMIKYRINRFPHKDEMKKSSKWVMREWEVLNRPLVIITLGEAPFILMKGKAGRPEDVGFPFNHSCGAIVYPMIHPDLPIFKPEFRPVIEAQWESLGKWLKERGLT